MTDERIKEILAGWDTDWEAECRHCGLGEHELREVITEAEAPLLEACKKNLKMLDSRAWEHPGLSTAMLIVAEAHDALVEAISKAEGKL